MKSIKALLFASIILFSGSISAQSNEIIEPSNVSGEKIAEIFKNAYMSVNSSLTSGNTVVIDDILKIYIDLDANKKYITYSITFNFQDGVSELKKLELVNKLNAEVLMIAPRYNKEKDNIWVKYDYWIEGGVTPKSIVMVEKQFVAALKLMIQKDTEKIVK